RPVAGLIQSASPGAVRARRRAPLLHHRAGAELLGDVRLLAAAGRMPEAAFAGAAGDVVDDAVVLVRADAGRHLVETERLADAPGDVVVGAGRVAGDADCADLLVLVEGESA